MTGLRAQSLWENIACYKPAGRESRVYNRRIRDRIVNLAVQLEQSGSVEEFQAHVVEFYREFGVGRFGLNKAFRVVEREDTQEILIDPIMNVEHVYFKDIVGYDLQKAKLIENTEAFVEGRRQTMCSSMGMQAQESPPASRQFSTSITAAGCA